MNDDEIEFRAWVMIYLVEHWWQVSLLILAVSSGISIIWCSMLGEIDWNKVLS